MEKLRLQLCYHDDGFIIAKQDSFLKAIDILSSPDAKRAGLHLSIDKCKVWWPTAPSDGVEGRYTSGMKQEYSEGTKILNALVGSSEFMEEYFTNHVHSLDTFLQTIIEMEDAHASFQLLRYCFGVCKISYLLRVIPPSCTWKGAEHFANLMENLMRTLECGVLDIYIFKELQFPLKTFEE